MVSAQDFLFQGKYLKFVDPVYRGWAGNPDSVTVRIMPGPPAFSSADSAAIKQAIKAWNDTGSRPKLKLIPSGTPQIAITRNDNIDGASGTTLANPDWENYESCDVQIDTDDGQPVLGIALHELGHCLGLNDTENKDDVMYGYADSCPLTFSKYDSLEVRDAATVTAADKGIRESEAPDRAIFPGEDAVLSFPVADILPDSLFGLATCLVHSLDPDVYVETVELEPGAHALLTQVYVESGHTNGNFYLLCNIMLPDSRILCTFLGTHCVNNVPVLPVNFECPMDIYELDGQVHVDWMAGCTYPYGNPLRSRLLVVGNGLSFGLQVKPDGDYILDLDPGEYTFTLQVNDFQVNTAYSTETVLITGTHDPENGSSFSIYPNPFTGNCTITMARPGRISIIDATGRLVGEYEGSEYCWQPGDALRPGVYFVRITQNGVTRVSKAFYYRQ